MANLWRRQPSLRLVSSNLVQPGAAREIAEQFFEAPAEGGGEAIGSASHIISIASVGAGHARVNGAGSSALAMSSAASGLARVPGQHAATLPGLTTAAQAMSGIVAQALHIIEVTSQSYGGSTSQAYGAKKGFLSAHGTMRAGF